MRGSERDAMAKTSKDVVTTMFQFYVQIMNFDCEGRLKFMKVLKLDARKRSGFFLFRNMFAHASTLDVNKKAGILLNVLIFRFHRFHSVIFFRVVIRFVYTNFFRVVYRILHEIMVIHNRVKYNLEKLWFNRAETFSSTRNNSCIHIYAPTSSNVS